MNVRLQGGQGAGQPGGNQPNPPADDDDDQTGEWQFRLNRWLIWFLGLALLGLVGCIVYKSVEKQALGEGITSLASLIGGGLLAFLNPVGFGARRKTRG
jgi:hypothetical protein